MDIYNIKLLILKKTMFSQSRIIVLLGSNRSLTWFSFDCGWPVSVFKARQYAILKYVKAVYFALRRLLIYSESDSFRAMRLPRNKLKKREIFTK